MADWVIYPVDRAAERFGSGQIYSAQNEAYVGNLVDIDQSTAWTRGSSGTISIHFDLGPIPRKIGAVFVDGEIAGEDLEILSATAFTGGSTTSRATFTPADNLGTVATWTGTAQRYWRLTSSTSFDADQPILTVALLDVDEDFEIPASQVSINVQDTMIPQNSQLLHAGGVHTYAMGGVGSQRQIIIDRAPLSAAGDLGFDMRHSHRANRAWRTGVVVTDWRFGETTAGQGPGFYAVPTGADFSMSSNPDRSRVVLDLMELPKELAL